MKLFDLISMTFRNLLRRKARTLLTMTGIAVLTIIPFTPFGTALGFVALPAAYFAYLIPCILLYMVLATSLKKAYVRHYGELL